MVVLLRQLTDQNTNRNIQQFLNCLSDPEDVEELSSASEPEEKEGEDAELQAATEHLTQDFLCQVIQEEEGRGNKTEQGAGLEKDGAGAHCQVTPLAAILGTLPSTTSPVLQQTFQTFDKEDETVEKQDGE